MSENMLKNQIDKEIESVEISEKVLSNILLEMRKQKLQSENSVKERKPFRFTARIRNAIALAACAVLMVVAIPFAVQNPGVAENPMTPTTHSARSYQMEKITKENLVETFPNLNLPSEKILGVAPKCEVIYQNHKAVAGKADYLIGKNQELLVEFDSTNSSSMGFSVEKTVEIKGVKVDVIASFMDEYSGMVTFNYNNLQYILSFKGCNDCAIAKSVLESIIKQESKCYFNNNFFSFYI